MTFAERLRKLRAEKGYSQAELGKLINVSAATVCNYEAAKIRPFVNTQIQLAKVLGVSVEELMKDERSADTEDKADVVIHDGSLGEET